MTYRLADELRRLHGSAAGHLRDAERIALVSENVLDGSPRSETHGPFITPAPGVEKKQRRDSLIALLTVLSTLLACSLTFAALVVGLERPVPPPSPLRTLAAPIEDECIFCRENLRWPHETNLVGDPCTQCDTLIPEHGMFSDSFLPEPPPPIVRARPLRLASAPNEINVTGPLSRQRARQVVRRHRAEIEACARNALFDELAREPEGMRPRAAHDDAPHYFEHVLSVVVQPSGRDQDTAFTEQPWRTVDGPMQTCLRRVAADWDFGASAVSLVRVHLHFEPL